MRVVRINRIRLEFKVFFPFSILQYRNGINRIRLEFKVSVATNGLNSYFVLIESDWNLKKDVVEWIYESDMY